MFLIIFFYLASSQCPYQNFNQSQLNSENFYEERSYVRGNPYAFGVWIQYAPIRRNKYLNQSKSYFNQQQSLDGFHILNFQSDLRIQTLFYQKWVYKTTNPILVILQRASGAIYQYQFQHDKNYYEGYWIFTYFSFFYDNKYNFVQYHTGDKSFGSYLVTNRILSTQTTNAKLEYGGQGQFKIGSLDYNFNIFSGRISIITIFQDQILFFNTNEKQKFVDFLSTCSIPQFCQNEQQIFLSKQPCNIQNCTLHQFTVDNTGLQYMFDFWIKRGAENLNSLREMILSLCGRYQNNLIYNQFFLFWINQEKKVNLTHHLELNILPQEIQALDELQIQWQLSKNISYFEKWVYLNYELYQDGYYQNLILRSYYSCCNIWNQDQILQIKSYRFFTNYQISISTSMAGFQNTPYFVQFQGLISNFRLRYCYPTNIQFNNQHNLNCHDLCKTCKGPTEFDCLSCYEEQNRVYLSDYNLCLCQTDYVETLDLVCKKNFKSTLAQGQSQHKEYILRQIQISTKCNYGEFEAWKDNKFYGCIQCPYFGQNNYRLQCINCLLNSQKWYVLPICNIEFQSDDSFFYFDEYLDYNYQELFLINYDLMSIELCNGCDKVIQEKNSRTIIRNLNGQNNFYLCKQNMYSYNNACIQCDQQCIYCKDDGICLECNKGFYLKMDKCHNCPESCDECVFNSEIDQITCMKCQNSHNLLNSICIQCGYLCRSCERRINKNNGQEYLKCLECQQDAFISLDGVNCYLNPLSNCILPFQYSLNNPANNIFYYEFKPEEQQNIKTACSFCSISSYLEAYDNKYFCTPISDSWNYTGCILLSKQIGDELTCLIGIKALMPQPYIGYCTQQIPYCGACYFVDWETSNFCLLCENGYYNDYYTSYCKPCPSECTLCVETDSSKLLKSASSVVIQILLNEALINYNALTRNPNQNEVRVKCTQCQEGYEIYFDKCIEQCPNNCKSCKIIDYKQICITCKQNIDQNRQIYNGKCIQCPYNCKLCLPREDEDKYSINPYFNNSNLEYFSHACVSPSLNNLFYDQDIKQFIECQNSILNCQKEILIEIFLYCNQIDLENYINLLSDEEKIIQSKYHMLLENFDLSPFEYDDYYYYLSKDYVKKLTYQFKFITNQKCFINKDIQFYSNLQKNCFNLIELHLNLDGANSILIVNGLLEFINFQQIKISAVEFQMQKGQIQIRNNKGFTLNLAKINIFLDDNHFSQNHFLISLIEVSQLYISDLFIYKANLQNKYGLFLITNQNIYSKLTLMGLNIKESCFQNTFLFHINSTKFIEILFTQIHISGCQFNSSSLISKSTKNEKLKIDQLLIEDSIIRNTLYFLDCSELQKIDLSHVQFIVSKLIDSNFIECSNLFSIKEFNIEKLYIQGQSSIFINQKSSKLEQIQIENGRFIDNTYSNMHAFMFLQNYQNINFTIFFNNIHIINNSLDYLNKEDQFVKNIELSIIYIEATNVIFENLMIQRGIGFSEITIKNSQKFQFLNSEITLYPKYQFKSLFYNQDCVLSQFNKFLYNNLLNFQEVVAIFIQKINVTNLILFDSVLFEIQMPQQIYSQFQIIESNFESNIIHQINTFQKTSLISITSQNQMDLVLDNVFFSKNLLNLLKDSQPTQQSLILIDALLSSIVIKNCLIEKNFNLNGQGSILYINSDTILIKNMSFLNNSVFCYDTIKQFLKFGFNRTIYLEDLQNKYIVESYGGNGYIQTRVINFENINIEGSVSKYGAAFVLNLLENGNVKIINSSFYNLGAVLNEQSKGGAFYIQSQQEYLNIEVINTKFDRISARKSGSIFYITPSTQQFNFSILNSTLSDIFSIQGGLLYVEKSFHSIQLFQMKDCKLTQNIGEFFQFINSLQQLINNELSTLIQDYTFIFCFDCQIQIMDFSLSNYPPIPLFQFYGYTSIMNVQIRNIIFSNQLMQFVLVSQSDKVFIKNLEIKYCVQINITESIIPKKQNTQKQISQLTSECFTQELDAPESILPYFQSNSNINQIAFLEILLNYVKQSTNSLISFTDFEISHMIQLVNLNLENITCNNCLNGLLSFENNYKTSIVIEKINILNSNCGKNGCVTFMLQSENQINQYSDLLGSFNIQTQIKISNLLCYQNFAKNGGCLYIADQRILITSSIILKNKAEHGGAIFTRGNNTLLISKDVFILNNSAQFGSGIYNQDKLKRNLNGIQLLNNKFQNYSNQIEEYPQQIYLQMFDNKMLIPKVVSSTINQQHAQIISQNGQQPIFRVPTGIKIAQYRKFEIKNNQYSQQSISMKLFAINQQLEIVRNLHNTYCELSIQNLNYSTEQVENINLSQNKFYFNETTFAYELDDLIFYIPQNPEIIYELSIQCNSIFVPILNQQHQLIENFHQNYLLTLLIQPLECQLGEFSQNINDYCHQCRVDLKQYSVSIQATYCKIVDDSKILDFTQAQILLKKNYWRMHVTSSIIYLCLNRQENCVGGWGVGNKLCVEGYIGALCEQCDYYNIRGGGHYQRVHQFECQICEEFNYGYLINLAILISLFALLFYIINQLTKKRNQRIRHNIYLLKEPYKSYYFKQSEVLMGQSIKIILFYFQIISITQELNSVFFDGIQQFIQYLGNPLAVLAIFQECQLLNLQISVVYIQILQNFTCIIAFISCVFFIIYILSLTYRFKLTQTTIYNLLFLLIFYFQNSIIRSLIQLIAFRQIQEIYWIYKNISYQYGDSNHLMLVIFCFLPILIILGIILPLKLLQSINQPNFLNQKKRFKQIGFWFSSYSNSCLKWESYKLLLNNGMLLIIILIDTNISFRGVFAYLLLTFYTKLFLDNNVYYHKQMNLFENQLHIISIAILVAQTFSSIGETYISTFAIIARILINVIFFLSLGIILLHFWKMNHFFIYKFLREIIQKYNKENKCFQKYSKASIEQRQKRFQLIRDYSKKQYKNTL